jgi:transcriptional regulator with XRE-family HTH domain
MPTSDLTFGQRVRELRRAQQLTQRELAARVHARLQAEERRGFDVTYLSKIENDRLPPPSSAAIVALAAELEADADDLLALAGKVPPELGQTLRESEGARLFYRSARALRLTDEEWKRLAEELQRRKGRQ